MILGALPVVDACIAFVTRGVFPGGDVRNGFDSPLWSESNNEAGS